MNTTLKKKSNRVHRSATLDAEPVAKAEQLSRNDGDRSSGGFLRILLNKGLTQYEKEHGEIQLDDELKEKYKI